MFEHMNTEKTYYIQHMNAREQHKIWPPVRQNKCWIHSILRQRDYVQQTEKWKLILAKKEREAYPEHNTLNIEKVANITVDSDS